MRIIAITEKVIKELFRDKRTLAKMLAKKTCNFEILVINE